MDVLKLFRFWRDASGSPQTDVPIQLSHYAPGGIEWGYMGAGPRDLALNIAAFLFPIREGEKAVQAGAGQVSRMAWSAHKEILDRFVATMPYEGRELAADEVLHLLQDRGSGVTRNGARSVFRRETGASERIRVSGHTHRFYALLEALKPLASYCREVDRIGKVDGRGTLPGDMVVVKIQVGDKEVQPRLQDFRTILAFLEEVDVEDPVAGDNAHLIEMEWF